MIYIFMVIGFVVFSALTVICVLMQNSKKDRHTWLNELFSSDEA